VIAISGAILDDPHPGLALLDSAPHVSEDGGGHIGVADDVLRRADQVGSIKATDFDEGVIAVGDDPANIGRRDQFLLRREGDLALRDRLIISHSDDSLVPVDRPSAVSRKN
jgi:hypothetical protein